MTQLPPYPHTSDVDGALVADADLDEAEDMIAEWARRFLWTDSTVPTTPSMAMSHIHAVLLANIARQLRGVREAILAVHVKREEVGE